MTEVVVLNEDLVDVMVENVKENVFHAGNFQGRGNQENEIHASQNRKNYFQFGTLTMKMMTNQTNDEKFEERCSMRIKSKE